MADWRDVITGGGKDELARSVERAISSGVLSPGERLPSVRTLARRLGISPTTVAAAVAELRRRGMIVTSERRTSVVASAPPLILSAGRSVAVASTVANLTHGGPDQELLPALEPALRAVAAENREPKLYGQPMIDPQLRELAVAQLAELGLSLSCDQVGVTSGALDLVERALLATCRPGDRVVVEDPGYPDLFDLLRANGLQAVPVAVDDEGLRPAGLRSVLDDGATALVHTPSAQNPYGSFLSERRAAELAAVLAGWPDVVVIEDHHLSMVEPPRASLAGRVARWAVARSVAKSLGPDLRLAVVAAEPHLFSRVLGRHALGPGWVSHLLQRTVVQLLRDPATPGRLEHARQTYAARRDALLEELRRRGVVCHGATGLNVWIPVADEGGATLALAHRGWAVSAGGVFRHASPPALRVTTSTLSVRDAPRLAEDMAQILRTRPSRSG
ncbi:MAG: aminotransferase class I/II-fold pyridoxal phosphate-dependent enzyme [Micromonosporaceae bacterium]|nr:aminotransferase class I/II-fold pyridoxal phosphate-dependent enzyme [Micromonosporaceae bacterium]